jgi:N-methylhydantoinase B
VARLRAASRTPDEREGDLAAQRASLVAGADRLAALCRRHGVGAAAHAADGLIAYGERMMLMFWIAN